MGKFKSSAVLVHGTRKIREFAANEWDEVEFSNFFFGLVKKARFVLVIRGLPGCGKSYLADSLAFGKPNVFSIDYDRFVSNGQPVPIDNSTADRCAELTHDLTNALKMTTTSYIIPGVWYDPELAEDNFCQFAANFVLDIFSNADDSKKNNRHFLADETVEALAERWVPYLDWKLQQEGNRPDA